MNWSDSRESATSNMSLKPGCVSVSAPTGMGSAGREVEGNLSSAGSVISKMSLKPVLGSLGVGVPSAPSEDTVGSVTPSASRSASSALLVPCVSGLVAVSGPTGAA